MEQVTAEEHRAGQISETKLDRLLAQFAQDGFVCLGSLITDEKCLDKLTDGLDLAAAQRVLHARFTEQKEWEELTNLGPLLPRTGEWVDTRVVASPIIEQIVVALLGGAAFIRWYGSNTALPLPPVAPHLPPELAETWAAGPPGSGMQHMHMDGHGWSMASEAEASAYSLPWPHPSFKIFCNIAMTDMTPGNGSTQLWPRSQIVVPSATHMACDRQPTDPTTMAPLIEQRCHSQLTRPVQLNLPRGAAVFRDLRCWHRGMPNRSLLPRHMMGVAFGAERDPGAECSFLGRGKQFHVFDDSAKKAFQGTASRQAL